MGGGKKINILEQYLPLTEGEDTYAGVHAIVVCQGSATFKIPLAIADTVTMSR